MPLARAVACGEVERGVAICGSGVGASVCANKVAGVRACLIHENFSAHQGVEDDDLNMICLGGQRCRSRAGLGIGSNISRRAIQRRGASSPPSGESGGSSKTRHRTKRHENKSLGRKAGAPGMLVDVPRLITAYYTDVPDPDGAGATGCVWHLRASRFVIQAGFQRMAHPRDYPGDLPVSKAAGNRWPAVSRH